MGFLGLSLTGVWQAHAKNFQACETVFDILLTQTLLTGRTSLSSFQVLLALHQTCLDLQATHVHVTHQDEATVDVV